MAKRYPQKYEEKLLVIKKLISLKSKLLSEYNRDFTIELDDYDYSEQDDEFYELVFEIRIKNVECPDCDFEIDSLSHDLQTIKDKILDGSSFKLSKKLNITAGNSTTRGVLLGELDYRFGYIQSVVFHLFIDPEG